MIESEKSEIKEEKEDSVQWLGQESEGFIQLKIVYWGPGESGKTTNFNRLRERYHYTKLTDGYSIETTDNRTLWQDSVFLSFNFKLKGHKFTIIAQIVTCTGQERFLSTREYILEGADGIVFVGDSEPEKLEQNKRSFRELISFIRQKDVPYVIQLNKRDILDPISMESFKRSLGLPKDDMYPDGSMVVYPSEATNNKMVSEPFQDLMLQVLFNYFKS